MVPLIQGLYDDLITQRLAAEIDALSPDSLVPIRSSIEPAQLPEFLTRFLAGRLRQAFSQILEDSKEHGVAQSVTLANQVLSQLGASEESLAHLLSERIALSCGSAEVLQEISRPGIPPALRPSVPLSNSTLFTGAPGRPQLGNSIDAELATADQCDMLVSFIKTGGLRLLRPSLKAFLDRGGKLRVITTSYMGASDPVAIEELAALPNVEVRVNYDTEHARLHAKAYFFVRKTGLSSAYIGSANLSRPAMTSGLEWTVKVAERELPDLFRRCLAEFSSYWENPEFALFDPSRPERFREAIRSERRDAYSHGNLPVLFTLRPYDYQEEILEKLQLARDARGHHRNLVVAATGTGKTMLAAFDYQRQVCSNSARPPLLYVAHRKEILEQALVSFRNVLGDGNFGGLLVDGQRPTSLDHVFCSVQSFVSQRLHENEGLYRWDYIVLDEAHHAEARSYDGIVDQLRPKILLGLTATPERADGSSVKDHFDHPVAAEIRLPDALQRKLLCPFHYFAISDHTVDLSGITWRRGKYDDSELNGLITGNRLRAQLILDKLREYLPDPYGAPDFDRKNVRGLGFCISVIHATFMAEFFNSAGVAARSLSASTSSEDRAAMRRDLEGGRIQFLFVVDVFNEGIDIPAINCVLFLRPTESHVVYLQQLGRGLRHASNKDYLTVLDFVGQCSREFRYDLRIGALLPGQRHKLVDEIELGFPHLPSGCAFHMERQAREVILESVKRTYRNPEMRIQDAFREWPRGNVPSFSEFLERTGEDPLEMLRRKSWTEWKALAGLVPAPADPDLSTKKLHLSLARVSLQRASRYLTWLERMANASESETVKIADEEFAPLAYELLWNTRANALGVATLREAFKKLRTNRSFISDLAELLEWLRPLSNRVQPILARLPETLELHGIYSSGEINAAFGLADINGRGPVGTGVIPIHAQKTIIHLVTFEKTEKFFSDSTMYRDYLTNPTLLHWESQSAATQSGPMGMVYAKHEEKGYRILFFSRIRKHATNGVTSPFVFLGAGRFLDAKGNKPIAIRWQLEHSVPMDHYRESRQVCGLDT